jgi:hypothetical protein
VVEDVIVLLEQVEAARGWSPREATLARQARETLQRSGPTSSPSAMEGTSVLPAVGSGMAEELARLGSLHQQGVLTSNEFEQAKARVLSGPTPTTPVAAHGHEPARAPRRGGLSPKWLYIAAVTCFVLFIGALQSEGRLDGDPSTSGDPNMLTPIMGVLGPVLLIAAVVWSIARASRTRAK